MKILSRLPWARSKATEAEAVATKAVSFTPGFIALHAEGSARWTMRSYGGLAREGFMRNPVAHRCVRMIAEAASAVPWLLYEGAREHDEHPLLALLAMPNGRMSGADFMETLYGHLLLSGNAYVEGVAVGGDGGHCG